MNRLIAVALCACSIIACSSQSPVSPGGIAASGSLDAKPAASVPGVYDLTFWAWVSGSYQEVSSLPVMTGPLFFRALVTDLSGNPATTGTVTFEYCSYGGRTNDPTNADEAPKEACEQGQAKWARLDSRTVGTPTCPAAINGSACYGWDFVRVPRTIGFRFKYAGKGTIASGTSPARNFVWVAQ